MKLTIVGTGYVGLVTGACFAEMGNNVTCVDVDQAKIDGLKNGVLPIYEPGLESIVLGNAKAGRLHFTTSLSDPMAQAPAYMIAVGTPPGEDGSADLQYVLAVARDIGKQLKQYAVVVDKSTVPVGTAEKVRAAINEELKKRGADVPFDVVSNPEFLKEGAAVEDFMKPDRVIIGTDSARARELMHELYAPFMRNHERILYMGIRDAEMTKYASNAMLATKISFMNEMAGLCDRMGVDVENVRIGIGADSRIGYSFIYPGAGYGGSCFPKDVKALIRMAEDHKFDPHVLNSVEARNERQKHVLFEKISARFGTNLKGKTFAVWGLAFKPGTDDMREAPSAVLVEALLAAGAAVRAHDPVAMSVARREWPADWFRADGVTLVENQYDALKGADALVLVTEWKPFRHPDFEQMKTMLKSAIVFDGRNQFEPALLKRSGWEYVGIGR